MPPSYAERQRGYKLGLRDGRACRRLEPAHVAEQCYDGARIIARKSSDRSRRSYFLGFARGVRA